MLKTNINIKNIENDGICDEFINITNIKNAFTEGKFNKFIYTYTKNDKILVNENDEHIQKNESVFDFELAWEKKLSAKFEKTINTAVMFSKQ